MFGRETLRDNTVSATVDALVNILDKHTTNKDKLLQMIVSSSGVWNLFKKCIASAKSNLKKRWQERIVFAVGHTLSS